MMSSQSSATTFRPGCSTASTVRASLSPANQTLRIFTPTATDGGVNFGFRLQCHAVSKPRTEEYRNAIQNGLPVIKWHEILQDETEGESTEVSTSKKISEHVDAIRSMFSSMDDGEISISAYDTAWVALVEDINGSGAPQFPSSLQWIANNQLPDGSWGDSHIFSAHDRIINTLACVIALTSWKIHPDKCQEGMEFLRENVSKLGDENAEHMPIGFEVAFPSLMEIARRIGIDNVFSEDSPILPEIYAMRDEKLTRIPKDIMHRVATTLLHSLEGMPNLEWEKLLKLQCQDGSFLFSPSSTAFALMQTKDDKCLKYLTKAVQKFKGGVPNVYPVDLFEHIWAVDRLQRLGISRYFQPEIKECVDYVYRYWDTEGICWARNSAVHDIDDTAMGFRLLRLHGYQVSADVFRHFKKGGEFFCFAGQSNQAVTGMFNLYRASQVLFPGEEILQESKAFSSNFLREKQASNDLLDKWIITKDLPGEVGYALDLPWYASLPRVETRYYLEHYGGDHDVWIGKTLYRMPYVNNNIYLDLAKLDYNKCQEMHQLEWNRMREWYVESNLGEFGMSQRRLLFLYYLATSSIFEPERSTERLAWTKTAVLIEAIVSNFEGMETSGGSIDNRKAFIQEFKNTSNNLNSTKSTRSFRTRGQGGLVGTLLRNLNRFSLDATVAHGIDIYQHLRDAWDKWLTMWQEGGDSYQGEAELLVRTINLCAGSWVPEESNEHRRLTDTTNTVCRQLRHFQHQKVHDEKENSAETLMQIESNMQELVRFVLCESEDGHIEDENIKQTFLTVAKSFYYTVFCNPDTVDVHISKVLFENVL